jgi:glyoxylase-like metal-dependent hydrolase (beta-lactamase superfamily II)
MELVSVVPDLYLLRFPVGNAYLWLGDDGLTLVDCGPPGSAPSIAAAIHDLGRDPAELRQLVLTHFHADHLGAAAGINGWGDVHVMAHHADAPFIRGQQDGPAPDLADWEQPLYARIAGQLATPDSVEVDSELTDGAEIGLGGAEAVVVGAPGHTPGSIALHVPGRRLLLTGDAVARAPNGRVMLGVFNADRAAAAASFRRLAALDADVACFGHGDPVTEDAATRLRAVEV